MTHNTVRMPFSGEDHSTNINSASWLQSLVRAATGRGHQYLPQDPQETGIILKGYGSTIPAWSLVGANEVTYPASPSSEPSPYLQASLGGSPLLLYVKESYPADAEFIEAFAFQPSNPVRVRVGTITPMTGFVPGMTVGRATNGNSLNKYGRGLVLVSEPYTDDAGENYYAWVVAEPAENPFWAVNIGSLAAPTLSVTGTVITGTSTSGNAAILRLRTDGDMDVTDGRVTFVRLDDGGTIADGTLIQLGIVTRRLTCVFANCGPTTGLTGLTP